MSGYGPDFYRWMIQTLTSSTTGYRRLNPPARRRRVRIARLGKTGLKSLKIKRFSRLRLSWLSPFALLAKLRDTYVSLLLAASNKLASAEGLVMGPFPGLPADGTPRAPFGKIQAKEYEIQRLLEIYLSMTHKQLIFTSNDPPAIATTSV